MKHIRIFTILGTIFLLSGCSGIAKGVTEAILEQKPEDTRQCDITGPAFDGITKSVERHVLEGPNHTTKVLMVHGISKHLPGYSAPFQEKLARSLGLTSMEQDYKEIKLQSPYYRSKDGTHDELGSLRVYRHLSPSANLELLFYELTWSPITDPRKELIAFDDSVEHTHRRAQINKSLKGFLNNTVPDLLIYLGTKKEHIKTSVAQSMCWMFKGDWDVLEDGVSQFCDPEAGNMSNVIRDDDFFFVTHSLGSRITTDMVHFFSLNYTQDGSSSGSVKELNDAIREEEFTVFMLANQLPLLELAHEPPEVTGEIENYCVPGASHYEDRVMSKMNIVAFSDPNDILSYHVPARFSRDYIDSRICPVTVNVSINVAEVKDVFGVAEFADPLKAHQGYHEDERIIGIITEGVHRDGMAAVVAERCNWTETVK